MGWWSGWRWFEIVGVGFEWGCPLSSWCRHGFPSNVVDGGRQRWWLGSLPFLSEEFDRLWQLESGFSFGQCRSWSCLPVRFACPCGHASSDLVLGCWWCWYFIWEWVTMQFGNNFVANRLNDYALRPSSSELRRVFRSDLRHDCVDLSELVVRH